MKTNRNGFIISLSIAIICLGLAAYFEWGYQSLWLQNLSFSVFGSCLLSVLICFCNYKIICKENAEKLVFYAFDANQNSFTILFSDKKIIDAKSMIAVVDAYHNKISKAYYLIHEMADGLF